MLKNEEIPCENLVYVSRVLVAHGLRRSLASDEVEQVLALLLTPTSLRRVDVTPDELYTSVYYLLVSLSVSAGADLMQIESKIMT